MGQLLVNSDLLLSKDDILFLFGNMLAVLAGLLDMPGGVTIALDDLKALAIPFFTTVVALNFLDRLPFQDLPMLGKITTKRSFRHFLPALDDFLVVILTEKRSFEIPFVWHRLVSFVVVVLTIGLAERGPHSL